MNIIARLKSLFAGRDNSVKAISFFATQEYIPEFSPVPASSPKEIPEWWNKMASYGGYNGSPEGERIIYPDSGGDNATIKRCIPVLDSMTMGYLIKTDSEIYIEPQKAQAIDFSDSSEPVAPNQIKATFPRERGKVTVHDYGQAYTHPVTQGSKQELQKVFTPWHVMVPDGHSVIMLNQLNNPSPYWEAVSGVMDADAFYPRINMMVAMNDPEFKGIIPAGATLCQIIPFKRESWRAVIIDNQREDVSKVIRLTHRLSSVFHAPYRKLFWSKKEFK
jgi:hypothetical protein